MRFFISLCLVLWLVVPIGAQNNEENEDLSDLNCAVSPDQLLGQANSGFAGAANSGFAGAGDETIEEAGLVIDVESLTSAWDTSTAGMEDVAILIVDDFSGDEPTEADDWQTAAHGWLVLDVLRQLRDELPTAVAERVTLVQIDVADDTAFRSDLMREELEMVVDQLRQDEGIERFVVNMSFVFVACADGEFNFQRFLDRHEDDPDYSVIEAAGGDLDYFETVLDDESVTAMDQRDFEVDDENDRGGPPAFVVEQLAILELFEEPQIQSDTLRDYFRARHEETIIPVPASGNFKWKRPFFPARWAEVISVSAVMGETSDMWRQSNRGEISTSGAWFRFGDDYYSAGTSFAAPVASMRLAVDQTQTEPTCTMRGNAPQLASNGRYNDVELDEAISDRCR